MMVVMVQVFTATTTKTDDDVGGGSFGVNDENDCDDSHIDISNADSIMDTIKQY